MRSRYLAATLIAGSALLAACSHNAGNPIAEAAATNPAPPATSPSTTTAPQASIAVAHSSLGDVLVDGQGSTLYGFTDDMNGTSTCNGGCATAWPPLIVQANFTPPADLKAANLHTIMRDDGQLQLAAGKWPLYTFAGDSQPGDVNGQGSLGKWFVVQPDGALHKALAGAAPAAAPAAPATPTTAPAKAPAAPSTTVAAKPASGYGY